MAPNSSAVEIDPRLLRQLEEMRERERAWPCTGAFVR